MTASLQARVLLVGCGKMGSALLKGWLGSANAPLVTVVEPGRLSDEESQRPAVTWLSDASQLPHDMLPDVIVFAVKPQVADDIARQYAALMKKGPQFLSIAAGRTVKSFEAIFGSAAAITRAMPNMPAAVGHGITICFGNKALSTAQRALAERLLSVVGSVSWVEDEAMIDAVTAVSGSGPAYVFLMVETMAAAGIEAGLPGDLAWKLARETVSGTGALLATSLDTPEQLRKSVTSPNGTTQAALEVLMGPDGLAKLMSRAVQAASSRSRELAS